MNSIKFYPYINLILFETDESNTLEYIWEMQYSISLPMKFYAYNHALEICQYVITKTSAVKSNTNSKTTTNDKLQFSCKKSMKLPHECKKEESVKGIVQHKLTLTIFIIESVYMMLAT